MSSEWKACQEGLPVPFETFHRNDQPDSIRAASGGQAPLPVGVSEIVVYTRPGCPYCLRLRAGLRRSGLAFREIDIWDDPDAAAFVRSVADGNETVPTVVVGDVRMVNPSARRVREIAIPAGGSRPRRRRWFRRSVGTGESS